MENNIKKSTHGTNNIKSALLGLLIGSFTGAITMLLFAPQSGKRTRTQIRKESIQFHDQATTEIKKATERVRSETEKIIAQVQEWVGELKQLGQNILVEQIDNVSDALDAGKTAVEAA